MSDKYFNEVVKSKNARVFDVRAEYDFWIENGLPHHDALCFAKQTEVEMLRRHEEQVNECYEARKESCGDNGSRCADNEQCTKKAKDIDATVGRQRVR